MVKKGEELHCNKGYKSQVATTCSTDSYTRLQSPPIIYTDEHDTSDPFIDQDMWTVIPMGCLGNRRGEYSTLYTLAKLNGHQAYIHPSMHQTLASICQITLPVIHSEYQKETYVGVHVRRGDDVSLMPQLWKGVVVDRGYLEKAMNYFKEKYRNAIFVVTSNGMGWCK
ncbi:hypothetical protein lerEdw1_020759 [Lerista edwardsae]|nr:hypothetical protein lerEdw1_020759 [Lerista edwardsae]